MLLNHRNLLLLSSIFIVFRSISAQNLSFCNRSCGSHQTRVQFPFGFSDTCKIPLTCNKTNGNIGIGSFLIRNVTSDSLLIDLPANCNRSITDLRKLISPYYAPTNRSTLLLRNCNSTAAECVIQTSTLKRPDLNTAGAPCGNVTCFSVDNEEFMSWDRINGSDCKNVYSSVAVDLSRNSSILVEFETVEIGWWINGTCRCSLNATCTVVINRKGYRCQCNEGFEGDGFADGEGCRRVSANCNASKYMSGKCGGNNRVGVLIGGLVAGASSVAILALLCYFFLRRASCKRTQKYPNRLLSQTVASCTIPYYPYKELERATNGFSDKQKLGTGAYGTVYAGKLHGDKWVAVKKIIHRDSEGLDQVMNEIKLLSSVSHPNLVPLLGCCIERGEQILVYEFMPNGTLCQHLQRERGSGLPWTVRLAIAIETAQAISYLHSAVNPPIYHRDIKSSNILLDYNFNSKVADFGLSRLGHVETSHISTAPQGTPGYLDPQYHQNFHLSDKSDVYSFGVVLVEIITAMKVVDFSRGHGEINLAALAIDRIGKGCVDEIVDPFLEPHRDAWTLASVNKVAELAFRCLAFHRDMRPSMMEVVAELEHIKASGLDVVDNCIVSSPSVSPCSSVSSNRSEKSRRANKKKKMGTVKLVFAQRVDSMVSVVSVEEVKESSPVSVQDPWVSEDSSPSAHSLLGNAIQ